MQSILRETALLCVAKEFIIAKFSQSDFVLQELHPLVECPFFSTVCLEFVIEKV